MDTEKLLEAINLLNTKLDALSTRVARRAAGRAHSSACP